MLSGYCLSGFAQTSTQTRTATFVNNLNNFQQVFGHQNYPRANAEHLRTDNNIYTCSNKLTAIKDSASSFTSRSVSSLALQGFGFTIPNDATIENIAVRVRRFKNGTPSVGDQILSVIQRYQSGTGTPSRYGVFWTYLDSYAGKIYPATETEYIFSQSGGGNNGGFYHNESYQWTPAMVNHQYFGVRIDNYPPIGKGSVTVCYDLVEVTVAYSSSAANSRKLPAANEIKTLKHTVFPNPFTTNTSIQFTAAETGNAVVELYNISGIKVSTLFSGNVVRGQVYNADTRNARLRKGNYVYVISNGIQKLTGRIMKLE